eukprot:TRINITY_DN5380_c0_g1_i2.p1 TRINITY_DN5380_c0_g1~~TRINITY_DN5380_c0_g1_i2.p1  ORF type:complete len:287 (-),score=20.26 TRINITY_DN5380_c0_g1_i2:83-943(-)
MLEDFSCMVPVPAGVEVYRTMHQSRTQTDENGEYTRIWLNYTDSAAFYSGKVPLRDGQEQNSFTSGGWTCYKIGSGTSFDTDPDLRSSLAWALFAPMRPLRLSSYTFFRDDTNLLLQPSSWVVEGCPVGDEAYPDQENVEWQIIDEQHDVVFQDARKSFDVCGRAPRGYCYIRFRILATVGGGDEVVFSRVDFGTSSVYAQLQVTRVQREPGCKTDARGSLMVKVLTMAGTELIQPLLVRDDETMHDFILTLARETGCGPAELRLFANGQEVKMFEIYCVSDLVCA